jgi:hypothetical protein
MSQVASRWGRWLHRLVRCYVYFGAGVADSVVGGGVEALGCCGAVSDGDGEISGNAECAEVTLLAQY